MDLKKKNNSHKFSLNFICKIYGRNFLHPQALCKNLFIQTTIIALDIDLINLNILWNLIDKISRIILKDFYIDTTGCSRLIQATMASLNFNYEHITKIKHYAGSSMIRPQQGHKGFLMQQFHWKWLLSSKNHY